MDPTPCSHHLKINQFKGSASWGIHPLKPNFLWLSPETRLDKKKGKHTRKFLAVQTVEYMFLIPKIEYYWTNIVQLSIILDNKVIINERICSNSYCA